jgi:hypothetical protein
MLGMAFLLIETIFILPWFAICGKNKNRIIIIVLERMCLKRYVSHSEVQDPL